MNCPPKSGRPGREINRRDLIEILEARAAQLFEYVDRRGLATPATCILREGIVLCGGGCQMKGMVEVAEKVARLSCPARLPARHHGWPDELMTPLWTVRLGLAMYSARLQARKDKRGGPSFWSLFTGRSMNTRR